MDDNGMTQLMNVVRTPQVLRLQHRQPLLPGRCLFSVIQLGKVQVDHLPVHLTLVDVVAPGIAAVVLCALVSGPVALVAAKLPLLAGLRR